MNDKFGDKKMLRDYLLGILKDDVTRNQIEMQILTDNEFGDEMSAAEDELVEEFLDGGLSSEDSEYFFGHFLASPERKRQLRLTEDLRRFAAEAEVVPPVKRGIFDWSPTLSFTWPRFAVLAIAIAAIGFGVWRFAIYQSDADQSLAQLRKAYQGQRPLEPRITALPDYVPYSETRGPSPNVSDPEALHRAEVILIDPTQNPDDAKAHQAQALIHLAQKKYDAAIREFDIALKAAPNDASLQSDAGAAYLQMAKNAAGDKDGVKYFEYLDESSKHLDLAISLAPKMPEPRFNKALCLEVGWDGEQAKVAWNEYLSIDSNSKWAGEARSHLQKLEANLLRDPSADELETEFIDAFRRKDEAAAAKLVTENRELIRDKYLPFRLSYSSLRADHDQSESLGALRFAGSVELNQIGDAAPKMMAEFYSGLSQPSKDKLLVSHQLVRIGLDACLKPDFESANEAFSSALAGFKEGGDVYGAMIAAYLVGYTLFNTGKPDEALVLLNEVSSWSHEHQAFWLESSALHWSAACWLRKKGITNALATYNRALEAATRIRDDYAIQRNLLALAQIHSDLGERQLALNSLLLVFTRAPSTFVSMRQNLRNWFQAFAILFQAKLFSVAQPAIFNAMSIADSLNDRQWMSQSRAFAGIALKRSGDIDGARRLLLESRAKALNVEQESAGGMLTAFANLNLGEFESSVENPGGAEQYYSEAVKYYDAHSRSSNSFLRDQAHLGLLVTLMSTGMGQSLDSEIKLNIQLAEGYRSTIRTDNQYAQFFDSRTNIYDIAADVEYDRGNSDLAFYYTEMSSARWLLEHMESNDVQTGNFRNSPDLRSLLSDLPQDVQVVRYSVLGQKTIVWVMSRERVTALTLPVGDAAVQKMVSHFVATASVETSTREDVKTVSRELYDQLVLPIRNELDPERELCIIPSKGLFDVPFAALTNEKGDPLISDFRIAYSPSVSVFISASNEAATRSAVKDEFLFAAGNPAIDRNAFSSLADLPSAASEVQEIAHFYSPYIEILVGRQATKKAFLEGISKADVVHFAGHHIASTGASPTSDLLFASDGTEPGAGELSNTELSELSLPQTRLVVLSACKTGFDSNVNGEGVIGLSHTMLGTKVPLVLASLWNVDSEATSMLMKQFHMYRRQLHLTTTEALRRAQLDLINNPVTNYSSPYYWAAFAVYGGHATF